MTADRFLAIPFVSQGRSYDGADCWGLVWLYYRDVMGIALTEWAHVPAKALRTISDLIAEHKREWTKVESPRNGDIVVMKAWTRRSTILDAHVGVVVNRRFVLHTRENSGPVLQRLTDPDIAWRIVDFRRHRLCP